MEPLQSQAVIQWRAAEGEDYPLKGTFKTVMFRDFVECGLAVPVSKFFHALLHFCGIQLHHLTPQSILHLSIFTHFCEAFLGILPHFYLFQHFFILVPIPNASKPAVVGGCELVLRPETRDEYLSYKPAGKGVEWKVFGFMSGTLSLHAKGLMAQWQRPLVGVLPPRVQILGAAPLCSEGFP